MTARQAIRCNCCDRVGARRFASHCFVPRPARVRISLFSRLARDDAEPNRARGAVGAGMCLEL